MHVCRYVMDHVNCIRIKTARQFSQILEEVMKSEKAVRNCPKKLKTTDFKQMEMVEPFHPGTYITWKCSSRSSDNDNNDDNDDYSGGGYEGAREGR
jgi:hypothetical protein